MINFKTFHKRMISEGGAFGHLSHPFDVHTFTFKDLEQIIKNILTGNLDYAEEKTDGINLMFTFRDGEIVAARNKSHLKNRGEKALNIAGIASKFKGRGVGVAYTKAMEDIKNAVQSLSQKQIDKIFDNGYNWMSIEVMMPENAENIIKYGVTEIRFHGTIKHDDSGEAIEQINKDNARMLDGMLRQRGAEKQATFELKKLNPVKLPHNSDVVKKKAKYLKELQVIMKQLGAKSSNSMKEVRLNYFNTLLNKLDKKNELSKDLRRALLNRWVNYDKSMNLRVIKKKAPENMLDGIVDIEKNSSNHNKQLVLPLEKLFLRLGAEVMMLMSDFMALNPSKVVQDMKKQVDNTAKKVLSSGDTKLITKLEYELKRLEQLGGWDVIVPSEGITFMYKGELLKITGGFAPANQIIGLRFRLPE